MFLIQLKIAKKERAGELMEGHRQWLARGFEEGVFLLAGNLEPRAGGAILAHGISRAQLDARVRDDPFVAHDIVAVDIIEIAPSRADERLAFLLDRSASGTAA
jgi:uncharacterized protein YciI